AVHLQIGGSNWVIKCGVIFASLYGDATVSPRWIALGYRQRLGAPPVFPKFPCRTEFIRPFGDCVDTQFNNRLYSLGALNALPVYSPPVDPEYHVPSTPLPLAVASLCFPPAPERSCLVLDPDFPCQDHSGETGVFPFSFGLPFTDNCGIACFRAAQPVELLHMYSMPTSMIDRLDARDIRQLARHLPSSLPFSSANAIGSVIVVDCFMALFLDDGIIDDVCRCLITKPLPVDSDWDCAYQADTDTSKMISKLTNDKDWTDAEVNGLHCAYRQPIRDKLIRYEHRRLVYYKPIECSTRFLLLIIVPNSNIRRILFIAYHAAPAAGHMGRYKTLYRLRIRFFWPSMRSFIEDAVKSCAHCIVANSRKRPASELDSPFCLTHVDLWVPGKFEDYHGNS
ncbi:MAG: integrase zinc binding domain-containing protein, partial [Gloeomargaritales cyanobacterium]